MSLVTVIENASGAWVAVLEDSAYYAEENHISKLPVDAVLPRFHSLHSYESRERKVAYEKNSSDRACVVFDYGSFMGQ